MPDVPSFAMRHVPVVPFAMAQESRKGFAIYTTKGMRRALPGLQMEEVLAEDRVLASP